jgi:hypothetical protein
MKPGDLVLIKDGLRKSCVGVVSGVFLSSEKSDWSDDYTIYKFVTSLGYAELVLEEHNAVACFEVIRKIQRKRLPNT